MNRGILHRENFGAEPHTLRDNYQKKCSRKRIASKIFLLHLQ